MQSNSIRYTIYDEVMPNPTILNVELARELEAFYYSVMEVPHDN